MTQTKEHNTVLHQNRRRKPDFWFISLRWFVVISWFLMITAMLIFGSAVPEVESFLDKKFNIKLINVWNRKLPLYLFYIMVVWLCISITGLVISTKRSRRKYDEYPVSLAFLGIISAFGIIVYFFLFT